MEKGNKTHLNVDDEDIVLCGWDDRGQGADESLVVEWREEGGGGCIVQSYCNRVIQHRVGNKSHEKLSHRTNFIDTV